MIKYYFCFVILKKITFFNVMILMIFIKLKFLSIHLTILHKSYIIICYNYSKQNYFQIYISSQIYILAKLFFLCSDLLAVILSTIYVCMQREIK